MATLGTLQHIFSKMAARWGRAASKKIDRDCHYRGVLSANNNQTSVRRSLEQ
jgi:hypothetical protein